MITSDQITSKIKEHLPSADIKAYDMTGTGDHWQLTIQAEEFKDKSMVEQHQLVYAALGNWMKKEIHALSLQTSAK